MQLQHLSVLEQMNVQADLLARQANDQDYKEHLISNLPLHKELGPISITSAGSTEKSPLPFKLLCTWH